MVMLKKNKPKFHLGGGSVSQDTWDLEPVLLVISNGNLTLSLDVIYKLQLIICAEVGWTVISKVPSGSKIVPFVRAN